MTGRRRGTGDGHAYGSWSIFCPPQWELWSAAIGLRELFTSVGPHLFSRPDDVWVKLSVTAAAVRHAGKVAFRHELDDENFQEVKLRLRGLRLIDLTTAQTSHGRSKLLWSLTPLGEQALLDRRHTPPPVRQPPERPVHESLPADAAPVLTATRERPSGAAEVQTV